MKCGQSYHCILQLSAAASRLRAQLRSPSLRSLHTARYVKFTTDAEGHLVISPKEK